MLRALTIRDFVIVEQSSLEFTPGFTALTGETGAGKSILIDALAAALGERSDATLVRAGAKQAEVAAEFDLADARAAEAWLGDAGLEGDPGTCLVRRVIESGGRSRAYINGRAVTVAQLRELGELLVDIHGQHAHQSLLRAPSQRALLDAFGGLGAAAQAVASAHAAWQDLLARRTQAEAGSELLARERDTLAWQGKELDALAFRADEWPDLLAEQGRLAHAANLIEASDQAIEQLSEADGAVLTQLNAVIARLGRQVQFDAGLGPVLEVLEPARIQIQEAVHGLEHYRAKLDVDPRRLAEIERRMEAVLGAARKFRITPDELPQLVEATARRMRELEHDLDLDAVRSEEQAARAQFMQLAGQLSTGRRKAATKLAKQVTVCLGDLALGGGRFDVALEPIEEGAPHGLERVEFRVAAHADMAPGPLAKVASGGELSRVSLAIQTVLSQVAAVPTLIFDEVDVGIGGRVAEIVGRMLRALGSRHQVMCVTHLPQVAACAEQQWRVEKASVDARVTSRVVVLDERARVEEVARMLGGVSITTATRKHAAEMLATAAKPR
jgi:DNA repair protein RecN (Recombination protein N)